MDKDGGIDRKKQTKVKDFDKWKEKDKTTHQKSNKNLKIEIAFKNYY